MKLTDYIRGQRKGKDARRLEMNALGDPFLGDALEGFDSVEDDHARALDELSARISVRVSGAGRRHSHRRRALRRAGVWASAAAIVMCVAISGLVYRHSIRVYDPMALMSMADTVSVSRGFTELAFAEISAVLPSPLIPQAETLLRENAVSLSGSITIVGDATETAADIWLPDLEEAAVVELPPAPRPEPARETVEAVAVSALQQRSSAPATARSERSGEVELPDREEAAVDEISVVAFSALSSPRLYGYAPGDRFIHAGSDPVSYVPAGAGAGSYEIIRNAVLSEGRLPRPGEVKVEELLNAFRYDYPKPAGRDPLSVTCRVGPCPWNPAHRLAVVGIRTGNLPDESGERATAAEDVKIKTIFDPTEVRLYRLVGYTDGRLGSPAGDGEDLLSESEYTFMYEIAPAAGAAGSDMFNVTVSYRQPGKKRGGEVSATASNTDRELSDGFYFASAVALFGQLLTASPYVTGDAGYDTVISIAKRGIVSAASGTLSEFVGLVEAVRELSGLR